MAVEEFLKDIADAILNPIIGLLFAIALLVFFWGIFQFVKSETVDSKREEGKKKILWGVFGMFIMMSAYGLIQIILGTFDIPKPTSFPFN